MVKMGDPRYYEAWKKGSSDAGAASGSRESESVASLGGGLMNLSGAEASKLDSQVKKGDVRSYNIRLDAPGGYSLAPDQLSPHNMQKRLFLPNRDLSQERDDYDYIAEIRAVREQRMKERKEANGGEDPKEPPFSIGVPDEEADLEDARHIAGLVRSTQHLTVGSGSVETDAQRYAASIDMSVLPDHLIELNKALESGPFSAKSYADSLLEQCVWGGQQSPAAQDHHTAGEYNGCDRVDIASLRSNQTTRTNMSRMTVTQQLASSLGRGATKNPLESALKAGVKQGQLDPNIISVRAPPGAVSNSAKASTPWDAQSRSSHRAFDRPTADEKAKGIAAFDDVSGIGRAPTASEVGHPADVASIFSVGSGEGDAKSVAPTIGRAITTAAQLRPADLFTPDPRPYRPLRYVRRSDPRQVLLLAAGSLLDAQQAASMAAAQATLTSGATYPPPRADIEAKTKELLASFGQDSKYGGIGVVYCPEEDPWLQFCNVRNTASIACGLSSSFSTARVEPNLSRRLERPPEFSKTTGKRAALRAVCAALEYTAWEEEGFDKIVIACTEKWIVQGISNWIWEWRANGWTLNAESPLGGSGEMVPDKDLWQLLDFLVRKYEEVDCNVRFWCLPRDSCAEMRRAVTLAREGAVKLTQQPALVRWKKKKEGTGILGF
ncbi:hypothetical protein K437DRAFT_273346 [Tilletiaria anomala UBC 951]|uniref:RNase H type-1 domain-containing protein n=1 Tax=Tilletiaria anomala (strain ATCC 24038 / CBS 436.72 / UBC 951) TaxID=1037660 RepID=A0A066W584_TILAU|nr:uncharacterized protein K437DRAFT_273346 [Tilletiaria anomala UBC 951]KDN48866.1 hypothetical protein K437DRAFT_273346 [Tilletiaria anomala UBC 951]